MTHFAAGTVNLPTGTKHVRTARPVRLHRTLHERRVFINAPIEEVLHHTKSGVFGERQPGDGDPRFRQQIHELGRQIHVDYTVYEIPGGTQISALIERSRPSMVHPLGTLGAEAAQRKVDARLNQVKDALE